MKVYICIFCIIVGVSSTLSDTIYKYQDLSPDLKIGWSFYTQETSGDREILLSISKSRKGWAAVGFGKGMISAEMIGVQRNSNGNLTVSSCYLDDYDSPKCGMIQGWKLEAQEAGADSFNITVSRSLRKVDLDHGKDISEGLNDVLFAYTDSDQFEIHFSNPGADFGLISLDFRTGSSKTPSDLKWGFIKHEYFQIFLWTVPSDFSGILATYFKTSWKWRDIHTFTFIFVILVSFIAKNTGQTLQPAKDIDKFAPHSDSVSRHKLMGALLFYILLPQIAIGIASRLILEFDIRVVPRRIFTNLHKIFSLILFIYTRYLVFIGTFIYWKKYDKVYLMVILFAETACFLCVVAFLEIRKRKMAVATKGYVSV